MKFISPSPKQRNAIKAVCDWYRSKGKQFFNLFGVAGSGKSSVIPLICANLGFDMDDPRDVIFLTPTNKAAQVLRRKGLKNVMTIHSACYRLDEEHPTEGMKWVLNKDSVLRSTKLIIADEMSMISEDLAADILSFKKKIILSGDPQQLPPVQGEGYFTKKGPDFFLDEVHRAALDSPIITVATIIREGGLVPPGDYGDVLKIKYDPEEHFDFLMMADQVITGTNAVRRTLNRQMADASGFTDQYPSKPGIKLVGTKNKKDLGLFNGCQYVTASNIRKLDERVHRFEIDVADPDTDILFKQIDVYTAPFIDGYSGPDKREIPKREIQISKDLMGFDFGYALSVHRSQGSEWPFVVLHDQKAFGVWDPELRKQFLYTAVTRASEKLVWLC